MVGKTQIMHCDQCGKELTTNEIGLTKKLISRKALEFLCMDCLASYLGTTREILEEKIEQFKEEGCDLFV